MRHIVATSLWHMVTIMGGGGALAALWARTATLSRRGRDRVTTRVVAESKAASDDTHGRIRTRFDAPHHVVIHSINMPYVLSATGANHLVN